jgi:site-specific recombinase XerD
MASLYRKPIVRTDSKTGERIKSQSRKWWGQYRDSTGRLHRRPLAVDKKAAEAMLNSLVRDVEREAAGLVDPTDKQRRRPLKQHLDEFLKYQRNRGVTEKQLVTLLGQLQKAIDAGKWKRIADITPTSIMAFLGELKLQGRSAQTLNHYLKSCRSFTAWLVRNRRTLTDPLAHLPRQNVATDRRHDRRALSHLEFLALVEAARAGGSVEGIAGPDRAMLYMLAAWTGLRKSEIGSLSLRSISLDGAAPTVTVAAGFSKRRRVDSVPLHPALVEQLRTWVATKPDLNSDELLFPITNRKAHKMIATDLAAARTKWIAEAKTKAEAAKREQSDFLAYRDHDGRYADFHSLRHLFITRLSEAGISPRMAQTLARHSDIRLTLSVYTHVELADQTAAIAALPGPSNGMLPRPTVWNAG